MADKVSEISCKSVEKHTGADSRLIVGHLFAKSVLPQARHEVNHVTIVAVEPISRPIQTHDDCTTVSMRMAAVFEST
jgi:hypothetical protein